MVANLVFGLPGERPGGLLLTLLYFVLSGGIAVTAGLAYAAVAASLPRATMPLQAANALLRGVPLLLLVFFAAHVPGVPLAVAGLLGLSLYSFSHVSETLRSFLAAYPRALRDQARVMGLGRRTDWLELRAPWTFLSAWRALLTHWVSLLKDTGALVVLAIGEMTTVARILSETPGQPQQWFVSLVIASALYLSATLGLIAACQWALGRPASERLAA